MEVLKRDAEKIFSKLEIKSVDTHHVRGWLVYEGRKILKIYYSHGKGSMPGRIGDMFRQSLRVNEPQFCGLRDCPISREQYIGILKQKGLI